ncbi:roadblock/LC7 domain-containing protein [Streptomyces sp. XM4193]|uniref:roadblock/LC7 domain-containing protein n=1 Tax=Streptomyces sp. XM4193 TaxID=2929782 RepID=UPI0035AC0FD5
MAPEPVALDELVDELRQLRARVPHLTGSLAASADGLVLAADTEGVEAEGTAALTAAALGVALRLADVTGSGGFRELVLRGETGYVATYAAGPSAVLTVLAEPRANVGRLHLEARRAGVRIAELLHQGAAPAPGRSRSEPARTARTRSPLPRRRPDSGTGPEAAAGPGSAPRRDSAGGSEPAGAPESSAEPPPARAQPLPPGSATAPQARTAAPTAAGPSGRTDVRRGGGAAGATAGNPADGPREP